MSDDNDKIIHFPKKDGGGEMTIDDILEVLDVDDEDEIDFDEYDDAAADMEDSEGPVVQLVNQILQKAILNKADSIHFECTDKACTCRFEKGRVLSSAQTIEKPFYRAISGRLKIISEMDITERRLPQGGSFKIRSERGKSFHRFYALTLPTIFGENITLRLAHHEETAPFELSPITRQALNAFLEKRQRLILMSSADLRSCAKGYYGVMGALSDPGRRIINIDKENSEEKLGRISHVAHVSYSTPILPVESALRSALLTEPNIIMVNTPDTSSIPHILGRAGSASDTLFVLSLKAFDLSESVNHILSCEIDLRKILMMKPLFLHFSVFSQNCPDCSEGVEISQGEKQWLEEQDVSHQDASLKQGKGCDACLGTGISGQLFQEEILPIDDETAARFRDPPQEGMGALLRGRSQRHPSDPEILGMFLDGRLSYRDFGRLTLR